MIEIINKKKEIIKPYYELTLEYTVGDSEGDTEISNKISLENPFIERFCELLSLLEPLKGNWGIIFNEKEIISNYKEGKISKNDCEFLITMMYGGFSEGSEGFKKFEIEDEYIKYSKEFRKLIKNEYAYTFLVYEDYHLQYIDEDGKKFEAKLK